MNKKAESTAALKALVKEYSDGFDVKVSTATSRGVVTLTEEGDLPTTSTHSRRLGWLKRHAARSGFEMVGPNQLKFLGAPEEDDTPTE